MKKYFVAIYMEKEDSTFMESNWFNTKAKAKEWASKIGYVPSDCTLYIKSAEFDKEGNFEETRFEEQLYTERNKRKPRKLKESDILIYFDAICGGNWDDVFMLINKKQAINQKLTIEIVDEIRKEYDITTLLDVGYPKHLKQIYKPPFIIKRVKGTKIECWDEETFNRIYKNWSETNEKMLYTNIPAASFIIKSEKHYTAIDNRDYCAWTEDFADMDSAIEWLKGE